MITLSTPIIHEDDRDELNSIEPIMQLVYEKGTPKYFRDEVWDIAWYIIQAGYSTHINTAILAAQILEETSYFQFTGDVRPEQLNFAGLGATGGGEPGASFECYQSGIDAICIHHLTYVYGPVAAWDSSWKTIDNIEKEDPRYDALLASGRAGTVKVLGDYGNGNWAEDPDYAAKIMVIANKLLEIEQSGVTTVPDDHISIVIAAGHHNLQSGNPIEQGITGDITERVYYHLSRQSGLDVVSLTPDGPDGDDLPGDGNANARIFQMWQSGIASLNETPDLCIEFHTDYSSNPLVRGASSIYPDWDGDTDVDVRNVLGPALVRGIVEATPISQRTPSMSERATAVGSGGDRLAMFSATADLAATTERLILECGFHSNPEERAWLQNPGHVDTIAESICRTICYYYGVPYEAVIDDADTARYFSETTCKIQYGFRTFWEDLEGYGKVWKVLGFPISDEFEVTGLGHLDILSAQFFERGALLYGPVDDVRQATLNDVAMLLQERYFSLIKNTSQVAKFVKLVRPDWYAEKVVA